MLRELKVDVLAVALASEVALSLSEHWRRDLLAV